MRNFFSPTSLILQGSRRPPEGWSPPSCRCGAGHPGYVRLEEHALEHLENRTILRRFESTVAEFRATDEDYYMAAESDERLRELARCIESRGLPQQRLPFVVTEWFSQRRISRERISWCRHLTLLQVLTHELHPSTHYPEDPPRFCKCEKHKYRSASNIPITR